MDGRQIEEMRRRLNELTFLHETSQVLTATLDLDSVLRSLMTQVRDYFQVEAASVALLDEETGEMVFRIAVGKASEAVIGLRMQPDQGIVGWVARTGEPTLVPLAHSDARFYSGIDDKTDFYTHALLAVPIKSGQRTIGVIEAINPASGAFDEDAQRLLLSVARLAAAAIRNAELYERARQAERRYESIFSKSTDPIIVLDLEGKILNLNQRAIEVFGLSRQQLSGAYLWDVLGIPPQTAREAIQQAREGGYPGMEVKVSSGETTRTLETHMVKIEYGDREAIQWLGHDVSERVALERMREDLTHMIVHDLRSPLGSIMSSLQLIRTALTEPDQSLPVTQLLGIAMRSGQKLYRLIDSLLDLGRLESGETELNKTPTSPQSLVKEAVEQIQPQALNREQTLTVHVAPDLPQVYVDADLIVRVLTNLLSNAVKFTPPGGYVTLNVKRRADELLFSVTDTGPGIPPESRQRIFDRFARLRNVEIVQGTGLGLAFCKLAVEAHAGRIWVKSKLNFGSTFYFTLPLEDKTTPSGGAAPLRRTTEWPFRDS